MKEAVINNAKLLQGYAEALLKDIDASRYFEQTAGIPNHPAWIVGHIGGSMSTGLKIMGKQPRIDGDWAKKFGIGTTPDPNGTDYPSKDELLAEMREGWQALLEVYEAATEDELSVPNPLERAVDRFPKAGFMVNYLLTGHPAVHLGQLSSWRRAAGYGSAT